jgi:hypothetical protein
MWSARQLDATLLAGTGAASGPAWVARGEGSMEDRPALVPLALSDERSELPKITHLLQLR